MSKGSSFSQQEFLDAYYERAALTGSLILKVSQNGTAVAMTLILKRRRLRVRAVKCVTGES